MSLILSDHQSSADSEIVLKSLTLKNEEGKHYFVLTDDEQVNEIRIPYVPNYISLWNHELYELFLFENPYLTAENDVFEIYEHKISGRFGWIFPIAALDSNENDFITVANFNDYRYVAYHKLLLKENRIVSQEGKSDYGISEIFPDLCVCLLSKKEIENLPNFRIEDYLLSFLNYDYLLYNSNKKGISVFNKEEHISNIRQSKHRITIKKSNFDITENLYTKSLFIEHLYQSENFLVRYIFLYQILEHFIEELADEALESIIASYQKKAINKNKLREKLSESSGERKLIKKIFEQSTIDSDLRTSFTQSCEFLFNDIGEEVKGSFEDILYDLRNLITHRYRSVIQKNNDLRDIIMQFEVIIIELLINYKVKKVEKGPNEIIH